MCIKTCFEGNNKRGIQLYLYTAKKMEMNRDAKISSPPASMITSGVLKLNHGPSPSPPPSSSSSSLPQQETVSCWMDIVAGSDPLGKPVETFLRVGQDATIVVRVRQTGREFSIFSFSHIIGSLKCICTHSKSLYQQSVKDEHQKEKKDNRWLMRFDE